jgi:type I restriction enzyme R subunit
LESGDGLGTGKAKDQEDVFLSQIVTRLNECFIRDELSDNDMLNYAHTVTDKLAENSLVITQMQNNTTEQALLGEFSKAMDEAILGSHEAHQNQMMQLLTDKNSMATFSRIVFDLLQQRDNDETIPLK